MAVNLPSDLIVDVMRAADPSRLKTAAVKLGNSEHSRVAFKGVMDDVTGSSKVRDRSDDLIADVLGGADGAKVAAAEAKLAGLTPYSVAGGTDTDKPYKAFEQMVLRNMFEQMMPPADSGAYGEESSGGIWRSLANDQLASVYSEWGGLGIARTLSDVKETSGVNANSQWPYFETTAIRSFTG